MGGLGSMFSGPDISGGLNTLGGLSGDLMGLSGQEASLAGPLTSYGNQTLGTAENQYQQGAAGQLSPGWNAMANNQLAQANMGTTAQYGNLGLGDSTMKTEDKGANSIENLAERGNLAALTEQLGLQGLQTGTSMFGTAGNLLGGAGNLLEGAGGLTQSAIQDTLNQATQGKAGLSSGLQGASSIGSALGGLGSGLGKAAGAGFF